MSETVTRQNLALNQLWKQANEQYHLYAAAHGLSDPAMWTLYSLVESDAPLTQNDIVSMWMYPKQTINFTISKLVEQGYVYLEQLSGGRNRKAIRLTDAGQKLCDEVICPLLDAEERALLCLTEAERELLITLNQKQCLSFKNVLQELLQK